MIIVDVETTGLDSRNNAIVSIGAVDFSNPKNQFYGECGVDKGVEIDTVALKINGFSLDQLVKKEKTLAQLMKEFLEWAMKIKDRTLAGYYAHFDQSFLLESAKKSRLFWPFGIHVIDIHTMFYTYMMQRGKLSLRDNVSAYGLDEILRFLNLPTEPHPHNALIGAKMTAEAFSRLLYGRSLLKEFEAYPIKKA